MSNRLNQFLCMNRNPTKELQSLSSLLLKVASISPVISCTCSQIWTKFYCQDLLLTRHEVLHLVWLAQPLNGPGVAGQFLMACPPLYPLCLEDTGVLWVGWDILFLQLLLASPCSNGLDVRVPIPDSVQFPQECKSKKAGNGVFIVLFSDVLFISGTMPHS